MPTTCDNAPGSGSSPESGITFTGSIWPDRGVTGPGLFDLTATVNSIIANNQYATDIEILELRNGTKIFVNVEKASGLKISNVALKYKTINGSMTLWYSTTGVAILASANLQKLYAIVIDIDNYHGFLFLRKSSSDSYTEMWGQVNTTTHNNINTVISPSVIAPDDPYGFDENNTPPGGYGGFDYSGDDVDIPALPTISAASCGFVGLYNPTLTELKGLANYMWTGLLDLDTYKKIFGDPMDCILSVGIIPITPSRSANKEALNFGNFLNTGITAYKITDQFAELDCGSVTIDGSKYTKSTMDYSPYTRAEIFLPFCGTHSISADEIMDATVSVVYHMDLYTGACVAHVKISKTNSDGSVLDSVLYQFTGNVLATIPITGADHSNFIQSILFMGAAAAASVATAGGAAPEIGGAMAVGDSVSTSALGGAAISASGINTVMSMKPNVMRSGNLAANAGFLGLKKPVITLTCPNLCRPKDENKLAGMPCQKSGTLSEFSGFNIVGACHLDNIPCTMEELRMIDTALAKGVIV